jgi:hypothetical protein
LPPVTRAQHFAQHGVGLVERLQVRAFDVGAIRIQALIGGRVPVRPHGREQCRIGRIASDRRRYQRCLHGRELHAA